MFMAGSVLLDDTVLDVLKLGAQSAVDLTASLPYHYGRPANIYPVGLAIDTAG
jgi:hypothetical protein